MARTQQRGREASPNSPKPNEIVPLEGNAGPLRPTGLRGGRPAATRPGLRRTRTWLNTLLPPSRKARRCSGKGRRFRIALAACLPLGLWAGGAWAPHHLVSSNAEPTSWLPPLCPPPTPSGNGLGVSLQDPPLHLNPRGLGGESPLPASEGGRVTRAWPTSLVHPLGLRAWFRDENVSRTGTTRVRPAEQVGRKTLTFQQTEMRKGERPGPPEPPGEGDGETAGPSPALRPAVPGPFQAHRVVRLKSVESGFAAPTTERAQSNMLSPSCCEGCGHTEAESALGSPTPRPGLEESSKAGQGDVLGGGPACGPGGRAPTWGTSKMQRPRPTPER